MPRSFPPRFSISPLIALVPGVMVLWSFSGGGVSGFELFVSVLVLSGGAAWAGFQGSREIVETVEERLDLKLASAVLDALPGPVMLLDDRRHVIAHNIAARDALDVDVRDRDLCLIIRQPEAQKAIGDTCAGRTKRAAVEIVFEGVVRRIFQLQAISVPATELKSVRAIVAMHEISALKAAEEMRADFVANVSHELRSPLSTLTGFIETLQTSAKDDPDAQERFLAIMADEAGRMRRLIDDLLSLSRIEANEHVRPQGRVDVAKILGAVEDAVAVKLKARQAELALALADDLADVVGDADELREVFQNLIENALKYGVSKDGAGNDGHRIDVTARNITAIGGVAQAGVEVAVRDFGDGIDPEHLPRLTERFYRVDKGRSRALGGTGLGLAIVKHIVNRHRGRLLIESLRGEGTVFRVQLPAHTQ